MHDLHSDSNGRSQAGADDKPQRPHRFIRADDVELHDTAFAATDNTAGTVMVVPREQISAMHIVGEMLHIETTAATVSVSMPDLSTSGQGYQHLRDQILLRLLK